MKKRLKCLLCGKIVDAINAGTHKKSHSQYGHYGIYWPIDYEGMRTADMKASILESPVLANAIGVKKILIINEGMNTSGSMKDYIVRKALSLGLSEGYKAFTVVSSGNHAVSLAMLANQAKAKSVIFAPATSSKISFLSKIPNTFVVGVKDAIFEDVYLLANRLELTSIYNANVSNDLLFTAFGSIAESVDSFSECPTHILSGVGNGSYLAGIFWGYEQINRKSPKIVPVGMKGAFPTERALEKNTCIEEYQDFLEDENLIDAAEGSIAIASYSMPQLIYATRASQGFSLGGLTNSDLANAYRLLSKDKDLVEQGAIPEPTGIMGLAAAIKHKGKFSSNDVLAISFTGHGIKDQEAIQKLVPELATDLLIAAEHSRPDLAKKLNFGENGSITLVEKNVLSKTLNREIKKWTKGGYP